MKLLLICTCFLFSISVSAQYHNVAPGVTKKKSRIKIRSKMDELVGTITSLANCSEDLIKYEIHENYLDPKGKGRFLPKDLTVKGCGKEFRYLLTCTDLKGKSVLMKEWLRGKWVIQETNEIY